ncbi:MAG: class I SAM-dependent methyltransferase [Acidobacteria bacterium]|nr:class I SAM-dependent methyltransferase [Acidobacteriota bacterium]
MAAALAQIKRPYSQFAPAYDQTIGWPTFWRTRRSFETLARRFDIRFRNAADLGCGTGLFARYLNQCWGVPVWAVDLSPDMLRIAADNCTNSGVQLLRQDMRCLRLPQPVELVTSNFDALNHLTGPDDLRKTFQRVADNLRPGGHFFFDLITPCFPLGRQTLFVRTIRAHRREVTQLIRWNPASRIISTTVEVRSSETPRPQRELHHERAYSFEEVGRWLMDAGFVIRGVYDEATLQPASGCPTRIIVIAERPV